MDSPSARAIARSDATEGLATPRSTCETKLSDTPADADTDRRDKLFASRIVRMRRPSSSSWPSAVRLFVFSEAPSPPEVRLQMRAIMLHPVGRAQGRVPA